MNDPSERDRETRELIDRFRTGQTRRKRLRVLSVGLAGAVLLAAIVVTVVWAARSLHSDDLGDSAVAASAAATGTSPPVDLPGVDAWTSTSTEISAGMDAVTTGPSSAGSSGAAPTTTLNGSEGATTPTASPRLVNSPRTTTSRGTTTTAGATTTPRPSATTSPPPPASAAGSSQKVVVLDPGHQAKGDSDLEPIGPGSAETKAKVSSGTAGVATGIPESALNLAIGLKLRDALEASGVRVVMTRTTQDVRISNIERAQIANAAGADLFVRIHADGSDNPSVHGIHVLYPASIEGWTDDIAAASKKAAQLAQRELVAATGAKDRGVDARGDMTGFNWADVPSIIPEIGFMTNAEEDRLLATDSYRDKIVKALARAILDFLGVG